MYEKYEKLLKERNLTSADVSRGAHIAQTTLSNWKKRRNNLSVKNLKLLASFFGVSVTYFTD